MYVIMTYSMEVIIYYNTHSIDKYYNHFKYKIDDKIGIKLNYVNCYQNVYALKDKNNFVHIIDFIKGNHCMLSLNDLIANRLKKSHLNYDSNFVIGYIVDMENNNFIPTVQFVINEFR